MGVSMRHSGLLSGRGGWSSNCLVVFADEVLSAYSTSSVVAVAAVGADTGVGRC